MSSDGHAGGQNRTEKAPSILSISYDEPLLYTREWILKEQGFQVVSACGFPEALKRCQTDCFDLAIMGHSIPRSDKLTLIREFKKKRYAPVLSLVKHGDSPLPEADYWVEAFEGPEVLVRAVKTALDGKPSAELGR